MPSDNPPPSVARIEYAERMCDGKQEVWRPDGKGWRVIPTRSVKRDLEKLGLAQPPGEAE